MIGRDDNQEEVTFKVTDRRKFNADGSLKEGVVFEPKADEQSATKAVAQPRAIEEPAGIDEAPVTEPETEEIPGAEDPASFVNFLSTLATNAAASLGAMPHPATGQRSVDLETGKYWLDILAMLGTKTKDNLHPQESRLLEGILGDLRMQYVTMVRATEEKLKDKAKQQFSGADILGKK
ncbi:MAG: DUF1844 domain-containing protein [Acidobacteriota bacterium]|jgi:hypothetical protein|nr:DUF1844 domain-containing protein [Blastocatellia bacterium]MDQ3220473.1 DUF1844 domain-containing protein [Acidobacteriota bacterium]MDQ3489528.1 DUF1844 domain-containing protein [Acidobacteriota bacterium]